MLTQSHKKQTGFTLVELMTVVAILGILAAISLGAYTKNVRASYRTQVIGNLSAIKLREHAFYGVRGHFASTTNDEDVTFPVNPDELSEPENAGVTLRWDMTSDEYTAATQSGDYFRGGPNEHGFDALNYLPEGGYSRCVYGVISGLGSLHPVATDRDVPPTDGLGAEVFPADTAGLYFARDWFYTFAKCDFDLDQNYWEFTTAHFTSQVSDGVSGMTH